ncbi:GAF domain-containing sensor histidine kinase [Fulvivirga sp. 29W222]|uniref:histidine kinase n=1 Tax=Fulvivirga marina TaxID=2494733 RepID=A0A937FYL0_9BACT|nr:GAF domain-containing sensor histidine kinase [Fulvivirga marina]MBL6448510.1 GAF domain-containing sensor histidine kinase [Fulvivirga marina]
MISAQLPDNEKERLDNLYSYQILDTAEEVGFNEIIKIAAYCCQAESSHITFIDKDRQWNKAQLGFEGKEAPRTTSFCAHTILEPEILEVTDVEKDERFQDNPFVSGNLKLRSYTGVPLTTKEGYNIGTLCVFDRRPRRLSHEQKEVLKLLARRVVKELELRLQVTEAEKRRSELQRLNEFKDKLLSIVSHDLRSPLNSIKSTIQLFESASLSEAEIKQLMGFLKLEANNTSNLLDNILQWAKAKLENFELVKTEFSINPVIEETVSLYKPEANRKKIDIIFESTKRNTVYGEFEMIKLVIRNLLNNSIKYCKGGDTIRISTKGKGAFTHILIEDTGVGMSSEKLTKILGGDIIESQPGTSLEKGIGLGLILINEFINSNNGRIMASSQPDEGTVFRIELPSRKLAP